LARHLGAGPIPVAMSFEQSVRAFLGYCRIECGFAPATVQAYASDLRELSTWLVSRQQDDWRQLNLVLITEHLRSLEQRGLAISSIARHVATIRVFARFLASTGVVPQDPAQNLSQPRGWQTLPSVLGAGQIQQLLEAPQPDDPLYQRDVAILELLYGGGLRASELAHMDQDQLHFDLSVVRVLGKGSKERIVPIGRPAVAAARRYLNASPKSTAARPNHRSAASVQDRWANHSGCGMAGRDQARSSGWLASCTSPHTSPFVRHAPAHWRC